MSEPTSDTQTDTNNETATGNASFQRPQAPSPATPPRAPFGAPGYSNFAGTPAANTQASPAASSSYTPYSATGQGRRLVVGEGISMSGDIEACENLVVEGTVDASLRGAKNLEITQNGTFYGSVEIDEATVAGRFEGDLKVNGRLTVRASGSIIGSVSYKELAIEPGAMIDGQISPLTSLQSSQDGKKTSTAGKGRVAAASFGKTQDKDSAESLFTRNRTTAAE